MRPRAVARPAGPAKSFASKILRLRCAVGARRRRGPTTRRRFAMLYDDARTAPKTAEEHERDAYGSTYLTGEEARRILAAHKVAGRSKLGADEARRMAREQWPDGVGPLLRGDRPEAVAAPFRPPGPLGYRGGLKRNPLFCCHFGTTASDASRVTDMVSLRFTISAPLRCSLPGQPRTPGWLPARIARRGARAGSHTGADTPAGGDPGPLGRPRPPRARLWACIHPPPCRRDGHRGRGPGGT